MFQVGEIIGRFEKKGFTLKGNSCSRRLFLSFSLVISICMAPNHCACQHIILIIIMFMADVKVLQYYTLQF